MDRLMSTQQPGDEFWRAAEVVCAQYGTTTAALVGRGRSPHVCAARQALYAVLAARGWGDVAIARAMGREHSTVHHGRRRACREQPEAIALALEALEPATYHRHMLAMRVPQLVHAADAPAILAYLLHDLLGLAPGGSGLLGVAGVQALAREPPLAARIGELLSALGLGSHLSRMSLHIERMREGRRGYG
jgi:hypothetical protein